jgi:hypothetical protein
MGEALDTFSVGRIAQAARANQSIMTADGGERTVRRYTVGAGIGRARAVVVARSGRTAGFALIQVFIARLILGARRRALTANSVRTDFSSIAE